MLNFTVGPVMSSSDIRTIGGEQTPYFRTSEFSEIMLENEKLTLKFAKAPSGSRAVFLTCSATGAMEAVVMNCFTSADKVLVIDGGSFGHRFVELCDIYEIPHHVIELEFGSGLSEETLCAYDDQGYTGLLVNIDETSSGVLYDSEMIGRFCRRNNIFYVCDCVSSFLADPFDMEKCGADVMITGSQKALACPPGIAVTVLSPRALDRIAENKTRSMYFDLRSALKNMDRGQTPFTPAVSVLLQINRRLNDIEEKGGVDVEVYRVASLALDFRNKISGLPLELFTKFPANAVTALHPVNADAYEVFLRLKDEYGIWICPNGGDLESKIFRVGHIGDLTYEDNSTLVRALQDIYLRGLL